MFKYVNSDMAELAHQLTLSPRHLRVRQIEGIERVLDLLDADKSYPYDWVCFHITSRRPHKQNQKPSVSGSALVCDLPMMAEHITRKGAPFFADLSGKYLTHDALSSQLEVSTKTIRRWRSRGLLGIRAVGDDGMPRLVFSQKGVDRFRKRNGDLVARGASFTLLSEAEKNNIVDLARDILTVKRQKLHIVARAVSERVGRAVETVRYTLRQYDVAHPDQSLFARNGEPIVSRRHRFIWRAYNRGESPGSIAAAHSCDTESILSVVREMRARILKDSPVEYIDNELFSAPSADALILDAAPPLPQSTVKSVRVPVNLPAYLRALYDTPLLTREQEADLFRRYNYLRFKAARAVEKLDVYTVQQSELDDITTSLDAAEVIKSKLIKANLRLVVSIAKRHIGWGDQFFAIVSDGNVSLIRAVEKFDFSLGNRFSTYASWAIIKNFARSVPEEHYHARRFVTGQDEMLESTAGECVAETSATDLEHVRSALRSGMDHLTERERVIVKHHFGLFDTQGGTTTLEVLGKRFGVTKERVRQIEKRAIAKLRDLVSPSLLDAFPG